MADKYWIGTTSGVWNVTTNWTPNIIPIAGENVFITDTAVSIDDFNNSAVALGIVTIGPEFTGNIGTKAGTGLILNCAANKRISITGTPLLTTQNFWIDYDGSSTDIDLSGGFEAVTEATLVNFGLHLKRTSGTVTVTNNGGSMTLDSGTFANMFDVGSTSVTVVAVTAVVTNYKMLAAGAVSTLNVTPTTIEVSGGTVTAEGSGNVINVEVWSGILNWDGGGGITSLLTVRGGTFDTSQATVQAAIADAVIFGDATTTKVDLTMATITNNIEHHGTPTILYPAASQGTLA